MLTGSINHVSITVSDLTEAMKFFKPFLEFLGYEIGEVIQDHDARPRTRQISVVPNATVPILSREGATG